MEERLVFSIKQICYREQIPLRAAQRRWGRLVFEMDPEYITRALQVFPQLIGIYSFSPAFSVSSDIEAIKQTAFSLADEYLKSGDSFALRVRRTKSYVMTSKEVEHQVGGLIHDRMINRGEKLSINLSNPDKTIFIEIRDDKAYFHLNKILSVWGGNPIERDKAMLSVWTDHFDPEMVMVASQLLIRRGAVVVPTVFATEGTNFNSNNSKFTQCAHILAKFYPEPQKIITLPFQPIKDAISAKLSENTNVKIHRLYEFYSQLLIMEIMMADFNESHRIRFLKKKIQFKAFITPIRAGDEYLISPAQAFQKAHFMPLMGLNTEMLESVRTKLVSQNVGLNLIVDPQTKFQPFSIADIVIASTNTSRDNQSTDANPIVEEDKKAMEDLSSYFNSENVQVLLTNCVENLKIEEISQKIIPE